MSTEHTKAPGARQPLRRPALARPLAAVLIIREKVRGRGRGPRPARNRTLRGREPETLLVSSPDLWGSRLSRRPRERMPLIYFAIPELS